MRERRLEMCLQGPGRKECEGFVRWTHAVAGKNNTKIDLRQIMLERGSMTSTEMKMEYRKRLRSSNSKCEI
ncbi:hypothetical protein HNY73_011909 [Argiope bruennichi]|uniref:Uncharacterized protein n=1 Tax=Argiope bruennichi TaxID=94029 RepID=A0A8T0EUU1_ARGBR|nr:hypothetical protein HNY73_011909 [Argiope bruennichi]